MFYQHWCFIGTLFTFPLPFFSKEFQKYNLAQTMKFSVKDFFGKCENIRRKLQKFTKKIFNEKLHFLCSAAPKFHTFTKCKSLNDILVKIVQIQSFFWSVFSRIQTEYGKIWTRKNSIFEQFSRSGSYYWHRKKNWEKSSVT